MNFKRDLLEFGNDILDLLMTWKIPLIVCYVLYFILFKYFNRFFKNLRDLGLLFTVLFK